MKKIVSSELIAVKLFYEMKSRQILRIVLTIHFDLQKINAYQLLYQLFIFTGIYNLYVEVNKIGSQKEERYGTWCVKGEGYSARVHWSGLLSKCACDASCSCALRFRVGRWQILNIFFSIEQSLLCVITEEYSWL